jgi:hypothetical protein
VGRPGDFEKLILNSQRIRSPRELLVSVKRALSAADGRIGAETTAAGKKELRMAATSALTFKTFS